MILVDTSVWVDHLRTNVPKLAALLTAGSVVMHSAVMGELACGSMNNRAQRIQDWKALPPIQAFSNETVLDLIESRALMSRGIGLVDAHLLCSVLNRRGSLLWTRDKRLREIAENFCISFSE